MNAYRFSSPLWTATFLAGCCTAAVLGAAGGPPIDVPERILGADRVVVATATSINPRWERNAHGDQLIVSQVQLRVDETLKGTVENTVELEIEGGTLGGVTLHVSDLPTLQAGERAVFFLDRTPTGTHRPHLRGQGILKLDPSDRVQGSSLRLADIQRMAHGAR